MVLHVFIITLVIWSASNGYAYEYYKCSNPWSCGNLTHIGYPFWGPGRPKYCGRPELQLLCPNTNTYPVLQIGDLGEDSSVSFLVLGISNNSKSLSTIKLIEKHPNLTTCPTDFTENHVFEDIFKFSMNVSITRLFHDCHRSAPITTPDNESVMCSDSDGRSRSAYYLKNFSDSESIIGSPYEGCKFYEAPVFRQELSKLQQGDETLAGVLKKGFEVDFYSAECIGCRDSGGACGSSPLPPYQFVCYCKSYPHSRDCRKSGKSKLKLALGLAISGGLCILIALNAAFCCCMKKFKFRTPELLSKTLSYYYTRPDIESCNSFFGIQIFSYDELQEATNDFDSARELGNGGFGVVYYGKLEDGREVAVKRLYENNYKRVGQFMNEVEILTNLHHQNLVILYGCTSRHSRELLLVYEYIPNGTVSDHLHGEKSRSVTLPWTVRMNIAIQTASALSYLHASEIIHRDVKTSNILLDNNFTVKVADFGLSRLFPFDATHVSTAPQGTPGYLDPEYHKCYQLTSKSDVYSLGVVLIELISSLPAVDISRDEDEINLSNYAMKRIQKAELDTLVDGNVGFHSDLKVKRMMTLVAELAFQCLQQEKELRPSMEEVFQGLKRIESGDNGTLESDEMGWSKGVIQPDDSVMEESGVVDHHRLHSSSPKSVIRDWVSRSSVASDPSSEVQSK